MAIWATITPIMAITVTAMAAMPIAIMAVIITIITGSMAVIGAPIVIGTNTTATNIIGTVGTATGIMAGGTATGITPIGTTVGTMTGIIGMVGGVIVTMHTGATAVIGMAPIGTEGIVMGAVSATMQIGIAMHAVMAAVMAGIVIAIDMGMHGEWGMHGLMAATPATATAPA